MRSYLCLYPTNCNIRSESSYDQLFELEVKPGEEGFYHLFFVNCAQLSAVSFRARIILFNVDSQGRQRFLSVGA
jgi:hypothetical protein